MIEDDKSLLPIITFDDEHEWSSLLFVDPKLKIARIPGLTPNGLGRLSQALKTHAACVAIEYHYIDKDYRNTFSGFHSKRFVTPPSRCVRLHFFAKN